MTTGLLNLDAVGFEHDPYPIGCCPAILPQDVHDALRAEWPAQTLFEFMPKLGNKYSLSEVNRPDDYHRFIAGSPVWRRLYDEVKAPDFVARVLAMLAREGVDLGLAKLPVQTVHHFTPWPARLAASLRRRSGPYLRTRFEFSMMPADGGNILPHTDHPTKRVTLVFSMVAPGEWQPGWGGGTDVLRPKDMRRNYNELNRQIPFEDCETLRSYAFLPNQCIVFVKTFNSLHSVAPMRGPAGIMRRTLTVNIEQLT